MLCLGGGDLLGEDNDIVFPDWILPVLTLEDENRPITVAEIDGHEDVDLVVNATYVDDLFVFDQESFFAQPWSCAQDVGLDCGHSSFECVSFFGRRRHAFSIVGNGDPPRGDCSEARLVRPFRPAYCLILGFTTEYRRSVSKFTAT